MIKEILIAEEKRSQFLNVLNILDHSEFKDTLSILAKDFFKHMAKDNPRSYIKLADDIDLFTAEGKCWVAVKENGKLKFITSFEMEDL